MIINVIIMIIMVSDNIGGYSQCNNVEKIVLIIIENTKNIT